jgi:hypothetical protein
MVRAKKPPHKKQPRNNETAVLLKSTRRCALCFHLSGDSTEKVGQVAHLDGDRTNGVEDKPTEERASVFSSPGNPIMMPPISPASRADLVEFRFDVARSTMDVISTWMAGKQVYQAGHSVR